MFHRITPSVMPSWTIRLVVVGQAQADDFHVVAAAIA